VVERGVTRTLLAAVPVVVCVIVIGLLADFGDPYSRTAYALGVVAATLGYLVGGWIEERG
jgi:hypothetical protein